MRYEFKEVIDLTYPIEEGMLTFSAPWHPTVEITQIGHHKSEGRETRRITLGSHTGTHIDAPLHFMKDTYSIDEVPLERLIGDVAIIDFTKLRENEAVTVNHLENVAILTDKIIFNFGWGKYWNSRKFYCDYPFFSEEAAQYLVQKGVKLVAMDTPSPDDSRVALDGKLLGTDKDSPIHKIFLGNGVLLVEYLANLDKVTDYNGWVISAMPIKIKAGDGAPARICIFK